MQMTAMPKEGAVLGIDVGYSVKRRSSAVCLLYWDSATIRLRVERFKAIDEDRMGTIARVVAGRKLLCAAFDGPLRRGFDIIGEYRVAEQMLTRNLWKAIGKPGQSSAPVGRKLNAAANQCVLAVQQLNVLAPARHLQKIAAEAIVEAFPNSFLGLLLSTPGDFIVKRGNRSDTYYAHLAGNGVLDQLIAHLLPGRSCSPGLSTFTNHDDRAAVVCAITALSVAAKDYVAVGDESGWIVLPPASLIAPWAWPLLEGNATKVDHFWRSDGGRVSD
jgi:hypothetical protein